MAAAAPPPSQLAAIAADPGAPPNFKAFAARRMSRAPSLLPNFMQQAQTESSETGAKPGGRHLKPLYQPSYRLGPEHNQLFNSGAAQRLMKQILENYLKSESYNVKTAGNMAKTLSDLIRKRLKEEAIRSPRYKIVVKVVIGQNQRQGFTCVSRCLWFREHDDFAEANFHNTSLFAVAMAFAVYHE